MVTWVVPTVFPRKDPVVRTGFCTPLSILHIWPGIAPHLSLHGPYVLDTGSRKDKEKGDNMDKCLFHHRVLTSLSFGSGSLRLGL